MKVTKQGTETCPPPQIPTQDFIHVDPGPAGTTELVVHDNPDTNTSVEMIDTDQGEVTVADDIMVFGGGFLEIASDDTLLGGTGDFTCEVWINTTDVTGHEAGGRRLFCQLDPSFHADDSWIVPHWLSTNQTSLDILIQKDGTIKVRSVTTQDLYQSDTALTLNQWNHVAVVRKQGLVTLYINGQPDSTITDLAFNGNFQLNNMTFGELRGFQGPWGDDRYRFYGEVRNIRITKQALFQCEFIPGFDFAHTSLPTATTDETMTIHLNPTGTVLCDYTSCTPPVETCTLQQTASAYYPIDELGEPITYVTDIPLSIIVPGEIS